MTKHPLSRRRCTVFILLFLLADTLNTDFSAAGPQGWLLCPLAALIALPLCRSFGHLRRLLQQEKHRKINRACDLFLLLFAAAVLGRMVYDFGGVLRTYNDFSLSPDGICLLLLALSLYLSRLRGHGLARTAELLFWPVAVVLAWTFLVGLWNADFGRLLPLTAKGSIRGTAWLLQRVFAQGILVQTLLEGESEPAALRTALRDGILLTGLAAGLFLAKNTAQVGWTVASRYTYPLYALAGLTRNGTGMHIEDLLICALLAARLVKGALLFRFMGSIVKGWRSP